MKRDVRARMEIPILFEDHNVVRRNCGWGWGDGYGSPTLLRRPDKANPRILELIPAAKPLSANTRGKKSVRSTHRSGSGGVIEALGSSQHI